MTADILFEKYKAVKPSSLKWERNVDKISDTATIVIPALCRMKNISGKYEYLPTRLKFTEGQKVEIKAGYDGKNVRRFLGFIKRINFTVPLEIECEGYAYLLRKLMFKNKSYLNTTVKAILKDVIIDTAIILSDKIPDIPIPKVQFKNFTRLQVLEYFKEKCLLTVYFNFNVLYVGLLATEPKEVVKHRLNWNVIKDGELLFNADKEFSNVNLVLDGRNQNGTRTQHKSKEVQAGNEKHLNLYTIKDPAWRQKIVENQKLILNNKGYTGSITAFLHPYCEPGMATDIIDKVYAERNGRYFIESVSGSFSKSGGRQKIGIGFSL